MSPKVFTIALLPGDGIGVEVISAAVCVLRGVEAQLAGVQFQLNEYSVGAAEFLRSGDPLPQEAFDACRNADAVLLGAMGLPTVRWPDGKEMTPQLDLREKLDLYSGIRPIRLYHSADCPLKSVPDTGIDLVIVRENCEGLFSSRLAPANPSSGTVCDVMKVTRRGAERICRQGFELARSRRRQCTLVDKANVLPSLVFFRSIFDDVARDYPDVAANHVYVDALALYLVQRPWTFDVLVTENMFGDILSDLAAGLIGGMGMAPSGDIGDDCAVFQPSHGSAPDIAGKGIANPVAAILSLAMLLRWLDHPETRRGAELIERSISRVLSHPENRTPDLGGKLTTNQLTDLVLNNLP